MRKISIPSLFIQRIFGAKTQFKSVQSTLIQFKPRSVAFQQPKSFVPYRFFSTEEKKPEPNDTHNINYYVLGVDVNPFHTTPIKTKSGNKIKPTTGIVGLPVVENWREVLISLYKQTLRDIQIVPAEAEYRTVVESFTKHRLEVVEKSDDYEVVENTLKSGQVEELIEQAKDELSLIPEIVEFKPWDVDPDTHAVPIIYMDLLNQAKREQISTPGGTIPK